MLRDVNPLWKMGLVVAMLLALGFTTTAVAAEDEAEEDKWDLTFDGHEMWLTDLGAAMKQAAQEKKHLLIDIYSRH